MYNLEISSKFLAVEASADTLCKQRFIGIQQGTEHFEKMYSFTLQDRAHIIH